MSSEHDVVFIPGLGEEVDRTKFITKHWRKHGLRPIIHSFGWKDKNTNFEANFDELLGFVDLLVKDGRKVSLIGLSAGGSAVLNVFSERKDRIHRVINVCGRLRTGTDEGFRSFEARTLSSHLFADSVKKFERNESGLSESEKKRVMTVRAMFGDELVPADTAIVNGAVNIFVPTPEHAFSIVMALTAFSNPLIKFIKES